MILSVLCGETLKPKKMKFKLLGKSGLRVSELALGTMTFGDDWGWGAGKKACKKIFDIYANAGGNFIDTANYYTNGTSEKIIGDLIKADRDQFVLATKYSLNMNPSDPNMGGNHRKNLMQSVEASLKRLNTDYIDILWLHAWDFTTPVEEVMRGLDDLIRQGKVHYIGISDAPAWVISKANTMAELRGWTSFIGMQMQYNLIERSIERELLPYAEDAGMSVLTWGPLASGILTGKYNQEGTEKTRLKSNNARLTDHNLAIAQKVVDVANELGQSPSQVALNWVRQQGDNMIPLLGSRKPHQLEDNLKCLDFEIPRDHLQALNNISKIKLGFPHDFLSSESVKEIIFGNFAEQF